MFYLDAHSAVQTTPLVPHNETYHATHWSAFGAVLLHLLSIDPRRVFNASDASFCVVSREKFALEVMRACAGKTVAVIDAVDMDLPETGQSEHARLWRSTCPRRVLQIVGSAAVLTTRKSACAQLAVPWVSHLYEPQRAGGERPLLASASWNSRDHGFATLYGFTQWRVDLRHGCHRHRRVCVWKYQSLSGSRAFDALGLYRASRFCLMPPGDTIVRQAIVDAVALGCVPVFFHPTQLRLWPRFWNARAASLLFNVTSGPPAVDAMFETLMRLDAATERALRDEVNAAGPLLTFTSRAFSPNALDRMLSEVAAYAPTPV